MVEVCDIETARESAAPPLAAPTRVSTGQPLADHYPRHVASLRIRNDRQDPAVPVVPVRFQGNAARYQLAHALRCLPGHHRFLRASRVQLGRV